MKQRHVATTIPGHPRSVALLALSPPKSVNKVVIFIHGWGGKATSTWADFVSLAADPSTSDWWKTADLLFFDYRAESVRSQIRDNAISVYRFSKKMYPSPPNDLFCREGELDLRPTGFHYEDLYLVGHSEGGLLTRHAILRAAQKDSSLASLALQPGYVPRGLLRANLRLFAPALAGTIYTGFVGLLARLSVAVTDPISAAKAGMEKTAPPVTTARDDTLQLSERYEHLSCFRAQIIWAAKDDIVHKQKYRHDDDCDLSPPGTDHSSICKPSEAFRTPITFVEKGTASCDE
jgi:pimeloyl-ACP methyl ester carboxylesterase